VAVTSGGSEALGTSLVGGVNGEQRVRCADE